MSEPPGTHALDAWQHDDFADGDAAVDPAQLARELAVANRTIGELRRQVRYWQDRDMAIDAERARLLDLVERTQHRVVDAQHVARDTIERLEAEARDRADAIVGHARREAARAAALERDRATLEQERLRREAVTLQAEVDSLRRYRAGMREGIRSALSRFEVALQDLPMEEEPDEPLTRRSSPPTLQAVEVVEDATEDTAESEGVTTSDGAGGVDAAESIDVTNDVSKPIMTSGPTRPVAITLVGVDGFRDLSSIEATIAAIGGVQDVWIRSFVDEVAVVEARVPINTAVAAMLGSLLEAEVTERSADELEVVFRRDGQVAA